MITHVCFYLDFGNSIGLGHLSRCSILSLHLQSKSIKTTLITSSYNVDPEVSRFVARFSRVQLLRSAIPDDNQQDQQIFCKALSTSLCNLDFPLLIIDHYYIKEAVLVEISKIVSTIQFHDEEVSSPYSAHSTIRHVLFLPCEETINLNQMIGLSTISAQTLS